MVLQNTPRNFGSSSLFLTSLWFIGSNCNSDARCYRPPVPENGTIRPNQKNYLVGSSVEYSCFGGGYVLSHLRSLTCLNSSRWDNEPPFCDLITSPLPLFNGSFHSGKKHLTTNDVFDKNYSTCMSQSNHSWDIFRARLPKRTAVNIIRLTTITERNSYYVYLEYSDNNRTKQCPCDTRSLSNGRQKLFYCRNCTAESMFILPLGSRTLDLCEIELFENEGESGNCEPLKLFSADGTLTYNRTFVTWRCDDGYIPKEKVLLNCNELERNSLKLICNVPTMSSKMFILPGIATIIPIGFVALVIWRWKRSKLLQNHRLEMQEKTSDVYPLEVHDEYTYIDFNYDCAKDSAGTDTEKVIPLGENQNTTKSELSPENGSNTVLVECEVYNDYSAFPGSMPDDKSKMTIEKQSNSVTCGDFGNVYTEIP